MMMTPKIFRDFENFAQYCKDVEDVKMMYEQDIKNFTVIIRLSKDNHHIQQVIDDYAIQNDHHFQIFHQMLVSLKNAVNQQQSIRGKSAIILKDGWLSEELNMTQTQTQTQFDDEKIKFMKEAAKSVMDHSLVPGILAGGCFTSWYHQEVPKDFDIFVIDEDRKYTIRKVAFNDHRFTISDGAYLNNGNIEQVILDTQTKVQYILVKYKTRKEIIDHFDAEHTAVSYDRDQDKLYISPSTYECIKNKIIKPHNNNKIAHWRVHKFKHKGFKLHETVSV